MGRRACSPDESIAGGTKLLGTVSALGVPIGTVARGRGPADTAPSWLGIGIAGWLIQLTIFSRTSAGISTNRKPPFCVSSVHITAPVASTRWLFSENQKRTVPFGLTGSKE